MNCRVAFPVEISIDEDDYFLVVFPDLVGAATDGETKKEAIRNATDCLDEAIANLILQKKDIPLPSEANGREIIHPSAIIAAKAILHSSIRERELKVTEVARTLGWDEKKVRRLLDPRCNSRLDHLEEALAALGKRLIVSEPAPLLAEWLLSVHVSAPILKKLSQIACESHMSVAQYASELLARAVQNEVVQPHANVRVLSRAL